MNDTDLAAKVVELLNEEPKGYETALLEQLADWLNQRPSFTYIIVGTAPFKWDMRKKYD